MAKRRSGASRGSAGDGKGNAKGNPRGSSKATGATPPAGGGGDCVYAGQAYSEGAIIDEGGVQQRCVNGKWQIVDPAHRGRSGMSPNA